MGRWTTLHLFDDRVFYQKVVPELKGVKGNLDSIYYQFLKHTKIREIANLSQNEIHSIIRESLNQLQTLSQNLDHEFKHYNGLDSNPENNIQIFLSSNWYYDFCRFFEYYLFYTCVDFFPHLPCGKHGLRDKLDFNYKLIGSDILDELSWHNFFSPDGMGIDSWITNEDVELLYYDKDLLMNSDDSFHESFFNLLQIAYDNKLGLIMGGDLREDTLENLPAFKLIQKEKWNNLNTSGLLFHR